MPNDQPDWLIASWQAPGIGGLMTTRRGGVSEPPFDSMTLHAGGGDNAAAVAENRSRLAAVIGAAPVFLRQLHGARVVSLGGADALPGAALHEADGCITTEPGIACTVQVADCLPVLFAAPHAAAVGAAHAGWRGLCAGVLEATLRRLCSAASCRPDEVQVWLGACIGPRRFEVGADVLQAFAAAGSAVDAKRFAPLPGGNKWLADLSQLARDRLQALGVMRISGGGWCTVSDAARFYSFRRDRSTGRMAAAAWIER